MGWYSQVPPEMLTIILHHLVNLPIYLPSQQPSSPEKDAKTEIWQKSIHFELWHVGKVPSRTVLVSIELNKYQEV